MGAEDTQGVSPRSMTNAKDTERIGLVRCLLCNWASESQSPRLMGRRNLCDQENIECVRFWSFSRLRDGPVRFHHALVEIGKKARLILTTQAEMHWELSRRERSQTPPRTTIIVVSLEEDPFCRMFVVFSTNDNGTTQPRQA